MRMLAVSAGKRPYPSERFSLCFEYGSGLPRVLRRAIETTQQFRNQGMQRPAPRFTDLHDVPTTRIW